MALNLGNILINQSSIRNFMYVYTILSWLIIYALDALLIEEFINAIYNLMF